MDSRNRASAQPFTVYVDEELRDDRLIGVRRTRRARRAPHAQQRPPRDEVRTPAATGSRTTLDTLTKQDGTTTLRDPTASFNFPVEPLNGPTRTATFRRAENVNTRSGVTVRFAGLESTNRCLDFFPTVCEAWRVLALFDSQSFAYHSALETGHVIGMAPMARFYPAQDYLKLVQCGWLTTDEFTWNDAKRVLKEARRIVKGKMKQPRRQSTSEPACDAPTFEERHDNVLRYADEIAKRLAVYDAKEKRSPPGEGYEMGTIEPEETEVLRHKETIAINAWRAMRERQIANLVVVLEAIERDYGTRPRTLGIMQTDWSDAERSECDSEMTAESDQDPLDKSEHELEKAHWRLSRIGPNRLSFEQLTPSRGIMTRSQRRKISAADGPSSALRVPRSALPRAACPPPLTSSCRGNITGRPIRYNSSR